MKLSSSQPAKPRSFLFWLAVSLPLWVLGIMLAVSMVLGQIVFGPGTDLWVYDRAADFIAQGANPYDSATFDYGELRWQYPPFALLLVMPLAFVPNEWLFPFWSIAAILLPLSVIVAVATRNILGPVSAGAASWTRRALLIGGLTVIAGSASAIINGWHLGQIGVVLMALVLYDLLAPASWRKAFKWTLPQGIGVGLATAIKLTPGIFIVHFLITRQWRAAITSILTVLTSWTAAFILFPSFSIQFWLQGGLLRASTENSPERLVQADNISFAGAFDRLRLMSGVDIHSLTAAPRLGLMVILAIAGLLAAAYLHRRGRGILGLLVVGLTATLVSPVAWLHHATWFALLAPVLFLMALRAKRSEPTAVGPLYVTAVGFFAIVALPSQVILTRFLQPEPINGLYFTAALLVSILGLTALGRVRGTADIAR